ncbi:MAG: MarR family transcriptional regulator [Armatimonadetes bacterium]|nr:MarR family transcriptional regulator [Armatimonadota bacterium]
MPLDKNGYETLLQLRSAIRKYIRFVDEGAHAVGITPQQHQLLLAIKGQQRRDWATVSEIADELQLKHNSAVGLANRCQTAGLIRKEASMQDRRYVRLFLTARGESLLEELTLRNLEQLHLLKNAFTFVIK